MALPIVPILGLAKTLIDKIFPDPQERAKAELALETAQMNNELEVIEKQLSAIVMEAKSQDRWTSRARPAFLYVVYVYLLAAIPFGFMFALDPTVAGSVVEGVEGWLDSIPGDMWGLFGAGYLGYTGFRSWDKRNLIGGNNKK